MNPRTRIIVLEDQWRRGRGDVLLPLLEEFGQVYPFYSFSSKTVGRGTLVAPIDDLARMRPGLIVSDLDVLDVGMPEKGVALIADLQSHPGLTTVPIIVVSEYVEKPSIRGALTRLGLRGKRLFLWTSLRSDPEDQDRFRRSVQQALGNA